MVEPGSVVQSGERIEAVLRVHADQPLQTLLIEDPRPACTEFVRLPDSMRPVLVSVSPDGWTDDSPQQVPARVEWRGESILIAVDTLPAGDWELRYPLRASEEGSYVVPGIRAWQNGRPDVTAWGDAQELTVVRPAERLTSDSARGSFGAKPVRAMR